mgnify:CR=1 FL=1
MPQVPASRHGCVGGLFTVFQSVFPLSLRVVAIAFTIVLAACQGNGGDVLESAAAEKSRSDETIGAGGTSLTMLLSGKGAAGEQSQDLHDVAAMAHEDLGAGKLALTFRYGAGGPQLLLGASAPVIAFADNSAPRGAGVFAMRSDAVDSALEGVQAAAKAGKTGLVVVAAQSLSEGDKARLTQGIGRSKLKLLGFASYSGAGAALPPQLAGMKALLSKADAVVIFGSGNAPGDIAAALRSSSLVSANALMIGNIGWARSNFTNPALEGALIALPDQVTLQLVSRRYKERYGRALTVDAAYGYDAIAVVAGIVRSIGPQGLTAETLTKTSGFRGTLGLFRFLPDGSVQRPLTLYSLANGTLKVLDPEPDGF